MAKASLYGSKETLPLLPRVYSIPGRLHTLFQVLEHQCTAHYRCRQAATSHLLGLDEDRDLRNALMPSLCWKLEIVLTAQGCTAPELVVVNSHSKHLQVFGCLVEA